MLIEGILFILTIVLVLFWLFIKRRYSHWERHGVDSIPAVFPFGSIKQCLLLRKSIGATFAEFYNKAKGKKYIGFYSPLEPMLLLRDPELIKTVLVKEFNSFCDNGFTVSKHIDPLLAFNPFGEKGLERWKVSRGIHTQMLTLSKIKIMSQDIVKAADNLTKYIATKCGVPLEVKKITRNYTLDAVMTAAYGIESDSFFGKEESLSEITKDQVFANSHANYASLSALFIPLACKIFRWRTLTKLIETLFLDMYKSCMEHRLKNGVLRNDILNHIQTLNAKAKEANKQPFSDAELAAHSFVIFGDGVETTSLELTYIIYALASDQRVQENLRTEIKKSIQNLDEIDFDKVLTLRYLEMVITEVMRLYTLVPFLSRTCTRTVNLNGLTIYPGTKVFVPSYSLHRDPEYYQQPEKFLPKRFSEENRSTLNRFTLLPFGEGPRICVGMRFAHAEIKIALIAILLKFKLSLSEETTMKYDEISIFLNVPNDVDVIFTTL